MKYPKTATALALASLMAFSVGSVQAEPIIKNPSFEDGVAKLSQQEAWEYLLFRKIPLEGMLKGWFSTGDVQVVEEYTARNGVDFSPTDGKKFVTMGGKGSFLSSSTFSFSDPTVTVLFDWFADYNDGKVKKTTGWHTGSLEFSPEGEWKIFQGLLGVNYLIEVIGLDNFRLKTVEVAEPATLALVLVSFLSFWSFSRRKGGVTTHQLA